MMAGAFFCYVMVQYNAPELTSTLYYLNASKLCACAIEHQYSSTSIMRKLGVGLHYTLDIILMDNMRMWCAGLVDSERGGDTDSVNTPYIGVPASSSGGGPFASLQTRVSAQYQLSNKDLSRLVVRYAHRGTFSAGWNIKRRWKVGGSRGRERDGQDRKIGD